MKHLIIANWKMNPQTYDEAEDLVKSVIKSIRAISKTDVVLCPPFVWLTDFSHKITKGVAWGAQNVFWEDKGAFTGEISPQMLKSSNVKYVIVGHSERRKYFGETSEMVNKKIKHALAAKLQVIFCVGENLGDDKSVVLEKQVTEGLKGITREQLKDVVVAYEPVWAIGTGQNCSVDQTLSSVLLIKKIISNLYNRELADSMRVLYGGSVNSQNSALYIKEAGVSGLLVGGASLNVEEFVAILKSLS